MCLKFKRGFFAIKRIKVPLLELLTQYCIKLILNYFKQIFSQNKLYYQILLKNKAYCGKWQSLI